VTAARLKIGVDLPAGMVGCLAVLGVLLCVGSVRAAAQMSMSGHGAGMGMQMKNVPAPDKLPVAVKMGGIGNSYLAIKATPEAQAWFEQGLNLLHDFWDYESAKAFEQGIRADSNCAMCYWGLYQALMFREGKPNTYTDAALAGAVRLKNQASKEDRLYIDAAVADDGVETAPGQNAKEIAVWRKLVKKYPRDLQAKIFLATSLRDGYDEAGAPKKGTQEEIAILEEVLKEKPDDSAANHYWIHAVEAGAHPELALHSATVLASLAPASGHMVHMPGHIFFRVGDYAQAEHWFAASTAVDEAYMRDKHVSVDDDWNYIHNLMYGVANLLEEGKLQDAVTLSRKLPGGRGEMAQSLYIGVPRDGMARLAEQLPVALRLGDWAGVRKMAEESKPDARFENLNLLAGQLTEFSGGMLAVENGDTAGAQVSSLRLDAALWRMWQVVKEAPRKKQSVSGGPVIVAVMPDAMPGPLVGNLSVMSLELRASILASQKQLAEAKAMFARAAREEKDLGYREPPIFVRPVGETEGAALMRAGDFAGAHDAYAAALVERPKSGFGLYGMARSSEAAGNAMRARTEYAEFLAAWKNADSGLPELAHAREYMVGEKVLAKAHVYAVGR
jgi:tetratricopeptide (TPR) repeat protein